jgi:hypothetical protein
MSVIISRTPEHHAPGGFSLGQDRSWLGIDPDPGPGVPDVQDVGPLVDGSALFFNKIEFSPDHMDLWDSFIINPNGIVSPEVRIIGGWTTDVTFEFNVERLQGPGQHKVELGVVDLDSGQDWSRSGPVNKDVLIWSRNAVALPAGLNRFEMRVIDGAELVQVHFGWSMTFTRR